MKSFKGTKGNWEGRYTQGTQTAKVVDARYEREIAVVKGNGEEWNWNAKLMAASPKLLKALTDLIATKEYKDTHGKGAVYSAMREAAWNQAEEAIDEAL